MPKLVFIFLLITNFTMPQSNQASFQIFPSTVTQTEPIIALDKLHPNLLFASAVTINTNNVFKSEGVYISTNGGLNWFGSDTCSGQLFLNHGGDPGAAITESNRLVLTHIGSIFPGFYSHYSDDFGTTWSNAFTITNQQTDDKGTTIIDDNINSPFYGRIYSAFVKLLSPYPVSFSYSIDEAISWSNPIVINAQPPARCVGPSIAINASGMVFVSWASATSQTPFLEDYIGFAVSSDGGISWTVLNNVFDVNGINGTLPEKANIRVNGLPRIAIDKGGGIRNNWIYIATNEKNNAPAGSDPDIILHRSTDLGISWSNAIRVNQDNINNGKIQYLPAIDIDEDGCINIIYYDDRNTSSDSAEIFLSRSCDGGETWIEQPISDHRFKPKPVVGGSSNYQGDYISLISNNNKLFAFWMDDYSGIYQIWMKTIELNPNAIDEVTITEIPDFILEQNFPNPFNPSTKINWISSRAGWQSLRVYDALGNEISVLIDEFRNAGNYTLDFTANKELASGIYFYQLISSGNILTKKMLLLR